MRPSLKDPEVEALVSRLYPTAMVVDLGGCVSLNLHIVEPGLVLRVHDPSVSATRLRALQRLRLDLAEHQLVVARPQRIAGSWLVTSGERLAEVEAYENHGRIQPTWEGYRWMFSAMGTLHRHLRVLPAIAVPRPAWSTYAPPGSLTRWLSQTRHRMHHDSRTSYTVAQLVRLVGRLRQRWVPASSLPQHVIHGDIRRDNVGMSPAGHPVYLDFGFAATRPRVHDVGYALSWIILQPDGRGDAAAFRLGKGATLLEAYEAASGVPLSPDEWLALPGYLASVPLYTPSLAIHSADPTAELTDSENLAFIDISEWVLSNYEHVTKLLERRQRPNPVST